MIEHFADAGDSSSIQIADDKIQTFKTNTHHMNTYNEIFNVNTYLQTVTSGEGDRLRRTNETLKSAILKSKQEYMMSERTINMTKLKIKLMYLSIIVLCLVMITIGLQLMQMINSMISGTVVGCVLLVYLFIAITLMIRNVDRKNINWNQYYWPEMVKK